MSWFAAWVPALLLAVAIAGVYLSGNDKAPVFVLLALVSGTACSMGLFIVSRTSPPDPQLKIKRLVTFLPLVYVLLAILLSRAGLDTILLLGFR